MNESSNTYQAVRIGDIADWRLICVISAAGMSAYLRNVNPTQEIVTVFDEKWNVAPESLLRQIESTVYDHPQVLDDFTADIVVEAPHSLWVPTGLVADDEDEAVRLYTQVYAADEQDIMADEAADATCLYTLVPRLNAFLQRTFPVARVHSHLGVLVTRFRERSSDMPRVYIDIRDGEADYVAFDCRNLLMAATHRWNAPTDLQYHLFNILDVYRLDPAEVQVSLSGPREVKNHLMQELRKTLRYVMLTMVPSVGVKAGMPLSGALMMRS